MNNKIKVVIHDDDCGERLNDDGLCPKCGYHPDMQSCAIVLLSGAITTPFPPNHQCPPKKTAP